MAKITTIPATIAKYSAVPLTKVKKRKTAAYARVSTDHEDQASSYEAQVDYYKNYIKSRDDWEFAGIYADKSTPRLIQFYTFKNAVKPPFLGGFFVFRASAA